MTGSRGQVLIDPETRHVGICLEEGGDAYLLTVEQAQALIDRLTRAVATLNGETPIVAKPKAVNDRCPSCGHPYFCLAVGKKVSLRCSGCGLDMFGAAPSLTSAEATVEVTTEWPTPGTVEDAEFGKAVGQ